MIGILSSLCVLSGSLKKQPMFADPPRSLYLILIIAAIVAAGVWARYQSRRTFLVMLGCLVPLTGLYLADFLLESPREEASRRVQAMAAAAMAGQPDEFIRNVSPSFNKNGRTRNDLRDSRVWQIIRDYNARVSVWNFTRDDFEQLGPDTIRIGFMAKGEAAQGFLMRYCHAEFTLESNGEWKLSTIRFYNPVEHGTRVEDPIPGFP